ncbi:MAG: hypothetical protein ACD_3C00182G0009, partial [uncultured bacterium (gcode 4)]
MNWKSFRNDHPLLVAFMREAVWFAAIMLLAQYAGAQNKMLYAGLLILRVMFVAIFSTLFLPYGNGNKTPKILLALKEMAWISVVLYGVGLFGTDDKVLTVGLICLGTTMIGGFAMLCINYYRLCHGGSRKSPSHWIPRFTCRTRRPTQS